MSNREVPKLAKFAKFVAGVLFLGTCVLTVLVVFLVGFVKGYATGQIDTQKTFEKLVADEVSSTTKPIATSKPSVVPKPKTVPVQNIAFGGPQLWEAVNKRRVELGVNPLSVKEEVCTIASIRLNQILETGKLDGHVGFSNMPEERPDLKWIFDKYNLSEFLVAGAESPQNAVDLWENSLGHKQLMSGGEFVWGCIYAQNGFGVAIAAY